MSKEFQELIMKKLITLLFSNLLIPIIRSPEGEGLLSNISDILRGNLLNMANFLDKVAARENLTGGEIMRELNSFIRFQWDALAGVINVKFIINFFFFFIFIFIFKIFDAFNNNYFFT